MTIWLEELCPSGVMDGGVESQSIWLPPGFGLWNREGPGQLLAREDWNADTLSSVRVPGCKQQTLTLASPQPVEWDRSLAIGSMLGLHVGQTRSAGEFVLLEAALKL